MAIQLNPSFSYPHGLYVIALVKLGRMDAACEAAARLLELIPFKTHMISKVLIDREVGADWESALRQAGIPD